MRAIRSQEKLAIAEAAVARLTAVGRDMHSTMVISRTRLQVRENHQMTKKNSFRTTLLPTLDKRDLRHLRWIASHEPTSRYLVDLQCSIFIAFGISSMES
jgi:hypothetical protein